MLLIFQRLMIASAFLFLTACSLVDTPPEEHNATKSNETPDSTVDITPPSITLVGASEITMILGKNYHDAGATARDDVDGNVTDKITVLSDVNISKLGLYHVTYNVSDAAGNAAAEVIRTVVVRKAPYLYGQMREGVVVEISEYSEDNLSVVYHPSTWTETPTPVVFFSTGFGNTDHKRYATLLSFVANHGYSVIYVPDLDNESYGAQLRKYDRIVAEFEERFDMDKIGVLGHSSGGGFTFKILEYMSEKNYGTHGRFLCAMDPYFAQYMDKENMNSLGQSNVLFVQFGPTGNGAHSGKTDSRIPLTEYALLTGEMIDKNYIVLRGEGDNDHGYPARQHIDTMQGLLKPLDALMEYSFIEQSAAHRALALEGEGKVDPYINAYQTVLPISEYEYDCHYANQYHKGADQDSNSTIDNCGEPEILPNN